METGRARVAVDFGLHQGEKEAERHNRRLPPLDPARLDPDNPPAAPWSCPGATGT